MSRLITPNHPDYNATLTTLFERSVMFAPDDPQFGEWYLHKFMGEGGSLWHDYVESGLHPYLEADKVIAEKSSLNLAEIIGDGRVACNFIGSGGDCFKERDLTQAFASQITRIDSMDGNAEYAQDSIAKARGLITANEYHARPCDNFFMPFDRVDTEDRVLSILFGGHFFNLPKDARDGPPHKEAVTRLRNLWMSHKEGDLLFMTSNTSQDKAVNEAAYSGPQSAAFTLNLVNVINAHTPYTLNPERAEYHVKWHPDSHLAAQSLILRDFAFQGEQIAQVSVPTTNVYMIPPEMFEAWALEAGWTPRRAANSNGVQGYILERGR